MDSLPATPPAIRFQGKSRELADAILDAFRTPERLPAALAPIFIRRKNSIPCNSWSWGNRLLVSLRGHTDARGFRQWQQVGRHVRKGEQALYILSPIIRLAREDEGEKDTRLAIGFRATPVFGYAQTEGEPLSTGDPEADTFVRTLPLREIAADWNITIETFNGRQGGPLGSFSPGHIRLGVRNLATWCHELIHAADQRNGNLKEFGQHWRSETVAELGGAVLLKILGQDAEADLGGCWQYIASYSEAAGIHPLTACQRVLKRTCDAVTLILDTADLLQPADSLPKSPQPTPSREVRTSFAYKFPAATDPRPALTSSRICR